MTLFSTGPCRLGSSMNTDGLCSKCPINTYTNVTGSKECLKCPDGTITFAEGSTECKTRKFIKKRHFTSYIT